MMDFLGSALALVVALGVLIAVHEYGHFAVARALGVKVLRFSIGFGKPIWRRKGQDGIEYVIASIPLGGYVKMLDEREGAVPEAEMHRAFNRQPVGKRFAIVAAGPLFNFFLAVVAFWLMFITGVPGIKAIVGEVTPDTPAARAGLEPGQEIVAVDGKSTPTWSAVMETLLPQALLGEAVTLDVSTRDGRLLEKDLVLTKPGPDVQPEELIGRIGLAPFRPRIEPTIGVVTENSPAALAGLEEGDRVVAIDGTEVADWEVFVERIQASPGEPVTLTVVRDGVRRSVTIRPQRVESEQGPIGRIGAQVKLDPTVIEQMQAKWQIAPLPAVWSSVERTWDMSVLTLRMLGEMLVGRVSLENISGPITIARYARESAYAGFARFLSFLAIVSISLGVLNLLPIPILDGGHLMFYVVEVIKGSPVSEQTEAIGQRIGIAIIIALMSLAFYNDLARLAG